MQQKKKKIYIYIRRNDRDNNDTYAIEFETPEYEKKKIITY